MITFHRILLAIACVLAFLAGAVNAGAIEIAEQRSILAATIDQPIELLVHYRVDI